MNPIFEFIGEGEALQVPIDSLIIFFDDKNIKKLDILADSDGYVTAIDTLAIGNAMCELGGGRTKAEDNVDHAVGFMSDVKIGTEIKSGAPIGTVVCRNEDRFNSVQDRFRSAYAVSESKPVDLALILETI